MPTFAFHRGPTGLYGSLRTGKVWACGHYDEEDDGTGNCRDEKCWRERLSAALSTGEATRLKDGTVLWLHGTKIAGR